MINDYEAKILRDQPDRLVITFNNELFIEVANVHNIDPRGYLRSYRPVLDDIRENNYEPEELELVLQTLDAVYKGHRYRPEKKGQLTIYDFD